MSCLRNIDAILEQLLQYLNVEMYSFRMRDSFSLRCIFMWQIHVFTKISPIPVLLPDNENKIAWALNERWSCCRVNATNVHFSLSISGVSCVYKLIQNALFMSWFNVEPCYVASLAFPFRWAHFAQVHHLKPSTV